MKSIIISNVLCDDPKWKQGKVLITALAKQNIELPLSSDFISKCRFWQFVYGVFRRNFSPKYYPIPFGVLYAKLRYQDSNLAREWLLWAEQRASEFFGIKYRLAKNAREVLVFANYIDKHLIVLIPAHCCEVV